MKMKVMKIIRIKGSMTLRMLKLLRGLVTKMMYLKNTILSARSVIMLPKQQRPKRITWTTSSVHTRQGLVVTET